MNAMGQDRCGFVRRVGRWIAQRGRCVPEVTMYSYAGPVIVEPSEFLAIGNATDAFRSVPKLARGTNGSHPLQTIV